MGNVEFVYLVTQPSDCVVGGFVVLCGCDCIATFESTLPRVSVPKTVWGWQDNVAGGDGLQEWQDNVSSTVTTLGKWE